ncbi:MAG: histidinol phosphatase [Burkholderiales bacterium]|nr:histidinol phosphatase [Flavobacterium sp.]
MFHFIIKKPFLKDLLPGNHIDIHSHLLPGIDDGAQTIEQSILLVSALQDIGVEQFITTPHVMKSVWENSKIGIETTLAKTLPDLNALAQNFSFKAAAEYLLDSNFVKLFQNETLLVLKENYVLVEMSYINPPIQLYDIIFELQVAGYQPVLAHPERYAFYHHNFKEFEKLKHAGCKFQLNLLSTVGYYGIDVAKTSEKLLKKGMIDFVGSDVHHENHLNGFSKRLLFNPSDCFKEAVINNQFFRM